MKDPFILSLAEVVEIHEDQITRYGGINEIRSYNLLRSAVAASQAAWNGEFLNSTIIKMAAAYI